MPFADSQYIDIKEASEVYQRGDNVTLFLKEKYKDKVRLSDIIEVAYDLQAGTYIRGVLKNKDLASKYWLEVAGLISDHATNLQTVLDVGTGELTTLSGVLNLLSSKPKTTFAFDISWSRIYKGLGYVREYYPALSSNMKTFCADIGVIPLPSSSIDLIVSSHALEPNRTQQDRLLRELVRVAKHKLMLFEPCYEINTPEGKARMDLHGYVKDLDGSIEKTGSKLLEKIKIQNVSNPLNPTVCYIVDVEKNGQSNSPVYTLPGTDFLLRKDGDWFVSDKAGLSFPALHDIPIFRMKSAVVSTAIHEK